MQSQHKSKTCFFRSCAVGPTLQLWGPLSSATERASTVLSCTYIRTRTEASATAAARSNVPAVASFGLEISVSGERGASHSTWR